jgi:predicted nuclease of predicted toxin-antitoxin system
VRFLLDDNLSPRVVDHLEAAGHDAVHVRSLDLVRAADHVVLQRAIAEQRVLVSADTDFGHLLATSGATHPSVILLRREVDRRASSQVSLVLANLEQVAADVEAGAIVAIEDTRVRVRRLPVARDGGSSK